MGRQLHPRVQLHKVTAQAVLLLRLSLGDEGYRQDHPHLRPHPRLYLAYQPQLLHFSHGLAHPVSLVRWQDPRGSVQRRIIFHLQPEGILTRIANGVAKD